nr:hypothetical protein [Saccharopolyspora erythraea]
MEPPRRRPPGDLRGEPNLARRHFLRLGNRESSGSEEFGRIAAARLRAAGARYPGDERLSRLLAELRANSEEFRELWGTLPVHAPGHRTKVITIPGPGGSASTATCCRSTTTTSRSSSSRPKPGSRAERAFRHLLGGRRG